MKLSLIERVTVAPNVESFMFRTEAPMQWEAGQYLTYYLSHPNPDDRGEKRWFTISSIPSEGVVRLTTRFNPERSSSFKLALQAMKPGDTINGEKPEGDFVYDGVRPAVMIAGGIGITPYRAILKDLVEQSKESAQSKEFNIVLLFGNRDTSLPFGEELAALANQLSGVEIRPVIEPQRIGQAQIESAAQGMTMPKIYVSGPEPMVENYDKLLRDMGYGDDDIVNDYFPNYEAYSG